MVVEDKEGMVLGTGGVCFFHRLFPNTPGHDYSAWLGTIRFYSYFYFIFTFYPRPRERKRKRSPPPCVIERVAPTSPLGLNQSSMADRVSPISSTGLSPL